MRSPLVIKTTGLIAALVAMVGSAVLLTRDEAGGADLQRDGTVVLGVTAGRPSPSAPGGAPGRPDEPGKPADPGPPSDPGPPADPGGHAQQFSVSGDIEGLFPGADLQLPLTLSNPNAFDILVTSLSVGVDDAGQDCGVSSPGLSEDVTVPARSAATTSVDIRMAASATDACQGQAFALTYSGQAVRP